ncbi:MAG: hypothetical protein LIO68_09380, partial [Rikenellaceae bacterium]|nr:hypothetical protein [Rikenellaceae bacterium]
VHTAAAQDSSPSGSLDEALYHSICERVQAPLVFSTRDTVFALSLPQDEPAEVYVQLTVGKNGKVKEKLTKVHANHIAGYVAPAFLAATKAMKVDKGLLAGITGKDTSLLLTFPMEYCHVLDTTIVASRAGAYPYQSRLFYDNVLTPWITHNDRFGEYSPGSMMGHIIALENPYIENPRIPKLNDYSGPLSFYIVFFKDQPE